MKQTAALTSFFTRISTVILLCSGGILMPLHAKTLYVDATANSGGNGSSKKPFAKIQKAVDLLAPGDVCEVRAGTYRESIQFKTSGTRQKPILLRAAENEKVMITGSEPVSGWKKDKGSIYFTDTDLTLGHENQVFCDNRMMWEARWPNAGGRDLKYLLEFKTARMKPGTTPTRIADSSLPQKDWSGARVWISSHKRWYCWTTPVIGHGKGWISIKNEADKKGNHVCKSDGYYYIFGGKAALDSENEWFYDETIKRLYVWAPGEENPADRISVKKRMTAIDLTSRKHITLQNITIHGTTIQTDTQSENMLFDGLRIFHPYHSNLSDRPYGAQMNTSVVLSGSHHTVQNSEIAYASGSGLVLQGRNHNVINNYIHDFDAIGSYASALEFGRGGSGHIVSHNTIRRAGRTCVGTPGFYDCIFQYNDVSQAGFLTDDLGLTYGNGVEGGNSEVRYNWLHENVCKHSNMGLYFDHGCRNIIMHHNVIWDVRNIGIINNMYGNYLLYYNNTVSDAEFGYRSTWPAGQTKDLYGCRIFNTVSTNGIRVSGRGIIRHHNSWNYRKLADKKHLTPETGPVDSGLHIPGITGGYTGKAPDRGAYELGKDKWKAGHDFSNPPEKVDMRRTNPPHRNLIRNAAFYRKETDPWKLNGNSITIITHFHGQWVTDAKTMMGGQSVCLGAGTNSIQQTASGLNPNTTYELMGMFRAGKNAQDCLAVRLGQKKLQSKAVTATNSKWQRRTLRFTTGPRQTSVTVIAEKITDGEEPVYVDDMGLQIVEK